MFKNLFNLPSTFHSKDRRRRQIMNMLSIVSVFMMTVVLGITLVTLQFPVGREVLAYPGIGRGIAAATIFMVISFCVLALIRSPRIPSWIIGATMVVLTFIVFSQADSPEQLYNGLTLLVWPVPIVLAAIILRPGDALAAAGIVSGLIAAYTLPTHGYINYFTIVELFTVAFICWLGMSIADKAIADAVTEAGNKETILNSIADGVLVLDPNGGFLSANPALLRMIPEKSLKEIISKPLEKTVEWKRKVFSVNTSPVPNVGTVAVFRDETRRRETERAKEALIATVSHELRTPLTAVMNYIEMLVMLTRMRKVDTEAFGLHLERALENSKRLKRLVDDILDHAQIEAGSLVLKNEPFEVRALLEKSGQLLDGLIKEKKLSYQLVVEPEVPTRITGDEDRLHQVMVNLLGNATKFTTQGGIAVRAHVQPDLQILSIEVKDSGPGIPSQQLPDIFAAFRRGSDYAQRTYQGAGLGLSIVKEIVSLMGGSITVNSEVGIGSTFTVNLPLNVIEAE